MQQPPSRLERLKDFLDASPNDTFVLFALAKEYEKMGDDKLALSHFQKLLGVDENYVGAFYHLGKLYERLGQPHSALTTYVKGMEVSKKVGDQHALSELAGAKLELGDEDDW